MEESDFEMLALLRKLDMPRTVAIALICLIKNKKATAKEIEHGYELRQPEVSVAMNYLEEKNWVEVKEIKKKEGKGRPMKVYSLIISVSEIIEVISQRVLEDQRRTMQIIDNLKSMT